MLLTSVEAIGFRNLAGRMDFGPGMNILWGPNAQGKTSVLEAIYTLANTKSFRTNSLREAITFGADEAIVRGTVVRGALTRETQVRIAGKRKEFYVNGKRTPTVEYISNLDAIVFSFEEMDVVRGEPSERRRFLDRGIVGLRPAYLRTLAGYNRILKQKNRLLRDARDASERATASAGGLRETIESWNDQLVEAGTRIHRSRMRYVELICGALEGNLFGENIEVRYRSSLEGRGDMSNYAALLSDRLKLRFDAELAIGHSLVGPHRDDLEVRIGGREVGRFGSAGQQRSALLILDLAQVSVYYDAFEEYPILLIDDIDAELDRDRIERLLGYLDGRAQTFVSTSKRDIAERYRSRAEIFSVRAGRVAPAVVTDADIDDRESGDSVGE